MIYRIDVRPSPRAAGEGPAIDPQGESIRRELMALGRGVGHVEATRVFLIDTDAGASEVRRLAEGLIADPITDKAEVLQSPPTTEGRSRIEIHLKPGVMDPVAASTEMAARDMGISVREVRTGRAYLIEGQASSDELRLIASRVLANGVIETVYLEPYLPAALETPRDEPFQLRHVAIRALDDERLIKLSREGHLFLSLDEMRAIQSYFRQLEREPTDAELETIAQTWSEHCVHKTLKSAVDVEVQDSSGNVVARRHYDNLIRDTIFESTMELMRRRQGEPFCLSVFKDNAGVVAFDETDAVCFKVETHNHPSAIEPYGGSATGIGGCIRDVLGTGLSAKPVANTDVFCVAYPDAAAPGTGRRSRIAHLPRGIIHPKRILEQIVAGVRDYGNRMGIPTINGAVYFDDRYVGNPLVFCGCVGLIPRDKVRKQVRPGDAIVLMGGRTGRDGIHGATFSSAELTDTHADEFSHAVQIGNAITQKKMADVILQARDHGLFSAITDCGAGGLSSAVGEMGEKLGARVELDRVPLKYAGLRYDEIWISEAQERMVLSVPPQHVEEILKLAAGEDVEATVIGEFGADGRELQLNYRGQEVGRLSMEFLHDGIPMPRRKAVVIENASAGATLRRKTSGAARGNPKQRLLELLAHPNIASKHWIVRQYDHEVQGGSVVKPLVGPRQQGPSDAAVVRPKLGSTRGVAVACGLAPQIEDPYHMAIAAIDEAVRNAVCVGADPARLAILDNFCWPSVDDEHTMGTLVRACEACRDAAIAFGIPFISGKDSLHNQFTNSDTGEVIRIPNTLLISAIGVVEDVRRCVTMDLKGRTNRVCLVSAHDPFNLASLIATHRAVAAAIGEGIVASCHDASDGGVAVAAAEMCIASGIGMIVGEAYFCGDDAFVERPGQYLVELATTEAPERLRRLVGEAAIVEDFGLVQHLRKLTVTSPSQRMLEIGLDEMADAWCGTLDW